MHSIPYNHTCNNNFSDVQNLKPKMCYKLYIHMHHNHHTFIPDHFATTDRMLVLCHRWMWKSALPSSADHTLTFCKL